jgi:ubiquinone/menaquinone biosynthesis C-methylase UbiE
MRTVERSTDASTAEGNAGVRAIEHQVSGHYAHTDLERTILDALVASGKNPDRLVPSDLSPVDEFHTGGRPATIEVAAQADFTPGMHLLDIGCGIGGASRYFAAERGCRVTGIDLTQDYVDTADALARRVGLADRVSYWQASALALPFDADAFDGAYMMHVGMNIEDKLALFGEVRRVLKVGSLFAIFDVMRTKDGALSFPLHWATSSETSFVVSPPDYRDALQGAGFTIVKERDRADFARAFFREVAERTGKAGGPPPLGIHILMKTDVAQKLANYVSALEAGVIAPVEMICRAR